ncbi:MAG: hypothetical protein KGI49_02545 [Patescibacteria group bacterium]|nr:hypothetical protein [Patescibacteria group bacterium]
MIQTVIEHGSRQDEISRLHGNLEPSGVPSEQVIPAVRGEYYAYSSEFTDKKPLYVFLKCKSNKSRTLACAEELGREANLVFLFGDMTGVCSIRKANSHGLLGDTVSDDAFGETWIAVLDMTADDFYRIRSQKDAKSLMEISRAACAERKTSVTLKAGAIIAMMTDAGKYGMFLVKELTPTSVLIDACHVLL